MSSERPSAPLLIVEDDLALQKQLKWSLDRYESVVADDVASAVLQFRRHSPAVVTMDLGLPPDQDSVSEGFRCLEKLLEIDPAVKVIVLTGQNDQDNALRAIRMGAYDFLAKPVEPEVLSLTVERAYRLYELQQENRRLQTAQQTEALSGLVTRDPGMLRICRTLEKVASSDATVLLLGESGTGKELLAQGLHETSKRKGRFVAINCAAIPENLLESELFGYEKGAFTGASKTTVGKIETANGGTLMLDEIGDLPMALQAKLLRFLQERSIERVGGRQEIPIDIRVLGATHQNLKSLISEGKFREDLYYRLAEIVLEIPPLRERCGDAVLLANVFLKKYAAERRRPTMSFAEDAVRAIELHQWPGNVRELQNVVKRASIMADGDRVTVQDIDLPVEVPDLESNDSFPSLKVVRENAEREAVVNALARSNGNIGKAALMLGVSRPTLYDLMSKLNIT
ncbi:PEP-CTERM-box response regulator transcription factor [Paucibacter sp. KCTC 42545]|uniref:PEP-CTERM-box response regulator transcription factor n=1 Tax=Paucibacter sp. KCTC 42545 TaxID=1768242 RepID=UPI000733BD80|nr:PEP-CTERM-box response regulator transcription factor [Paucibacter sp. KCTC 42545]ALT77292.1 PEP-CTERM-box response regulator transcription factor [Paucibacter sp. KCTC 42545]